MDHAELCETNPAVDDQTTNNTGLDDEAVIPSRAGTSAIEVARQTDVTSRGRGRPSLKDSVKLALERQTRLANPPTRASARFQKASTETIASLEKEGKILCRHNSSDSFDAVILSDRSVGRLQLNEMHAAALATTRMRMQRSFNFN